MNIRLIGLRKSAELDWLISTTFQVVIDDNDMTYTAKLLDQGQIIWSVNFTKFYLARKKAQKLSNRGLVSYVIGGGIIWSIFQGGRQITIKQTEK